MIGSLFGLNVLGVLPGRALPTRVRRLCSNFKHKQGTRAAAKAACTVSGHGFDLAEESTGAVGKATP